MINSQRKISLVIQEMCECIPKLEAEILCAVILNCSRTQLITHDEDLLDPMCISMCFELARKRAAGIPMAYLVQYKEFYSLNFFVTPAVLIPRPETEFLVDQALKFLATDRTKCKRVLELGTGCGAVSIAIKKHCPEANFVATDISPCALEIARHNADRLLTLDTKETLCFLHGNWYEALNNCHSEAMVYHVYDKQRFDLIISNPPYISINDPHLAQGDLRFEPVYALTDYKDGLFAIEQIIQAAPEWLLPNGALWLEHGYMQHKFVFEMFSDYGFDSIESIRDFSGIERVTGGYLRRKI